MMTKAPLGRGVNLLVAAGIAVVGAIVVGVLASPGQGAPKLPPAASSEIQRTEAQLAQGLPGPEASGALAARLESAGLKASVRTTGGTSMGPKPGAAVGLALDAALTGSPTVVAVDGAGGNQVIAAPVRAPDGKVVVAVATGAVTEGGGFGAGAAVAAFVVALAAALAVFVLAGAAAPDQAAAIPLPPPPPAEPAPVETAVPAPTGGRTAASEEAVLERDALVRTCIDVRDKVTSEALRERLGHALASAGVVEIDPVGQPYDKEHHVALETEDTADPALDRVVAGTVTVGYQDHGLVLRAPEVRVYGKAGGQQLPKATR